jgi:hypothetical protein
MITRSRWLWPALLLGAALSAHALPQLSIHLPVPGYDLYYVGDLDIRGHMTGVANEISVSLDLDQNVRYEIQIGLYFAGTWLVEGTVWADITNAPVHYEWNLNQIRQGEGLGPFHGDAGEFNDTFLDQISGNALPSGVYTVTAHFVEPAGVPDISASFTVNDPRNIELQTPWDGALVYNDQPTFSWSGRARNYRLRVCEFNPDFHGSPQEALEGEPMWVAQLSAPSCVYGQGGGARPLQDGRQYVWMVEALLSTTSGDQAFPSAIRRFRLSLGQGGNLEPELASLLEGLTPGQLAGIGDLLEGFHLSGSILIDGQPVSPEELQQLLEQLASGELNIASIRIE